jgi:hypothetical protein
MSYAMKRFYLYDQEGREGCYNQTAKLSHKQLTNYCQEINEIDDQVQAHEAEALKQLNPLRYLMLQGEINRLIREEHAVQGKWSNAMVELAVCRSGRLTAPH